MLAGHGEALDTVNPATDEKIATVQTASTEDIDNAVAVARKCFEEEWGLNTPGSTRSSLIWAYADVSSLSSCRSKGDADWLS